MTSPPVYFKGTLRFLRKKLSYSAPTSSSLAEQPFLSHNLPQKILPHFNCFSLLWISQQYLSFYRSRSSALYPTPNLEGQVLYLSPSDRMTHLYPQPPGSLFVAFLRLGRLRWRYSDPTPQRDCLFYIKNRHRCGTITGL
jgi:hypothetical protein